MRTSPYPYFLESYLQYLKWRVLLNVDPEGHTVSGIEHIMLFKKLLKPFVHDLFKYSI